MNRTVKEIEYFKPRLFEHYKNSSLQELLTTITMVDWKVVWSYTTFGVLILTFGPAENFTDKYFKYQIEFYPLSNFAITLYKIKNIKELEQAGWSLRLSEEGIFKTLIDMIARGEDIE